MFLTKVMLKVGTVSKYYEKTGVSIVTLISDLSINDNIRVMDRLKDSIQPKIIFIQVGFKKINFAPKGETVAIKFDEQIKEGSEIFRG
ncbi:hypothetical protein A2616_02575 [Candidatus Woesebacteria bacterium RIFOXYD1_FULL_33_11]|nr:MAG: hypothetical protein A2616_02575 [Candidatus Woesebacteria bacterium RIFOXYD1_FULL_33_11]